MFLNQLVHHQYLEFVRLDHTIQFDQVPVDYLCNNYQVDNTSMLALSQKH